MRDSGLKLEKAALDYISDRRDWDSLHQLALDMETENDLDFPSEVRRPLEELHLLFLTADSNDDAQFRASKEEIWALVNEIERLRRESAALGAEVVSTGEQILENERNEELRSKYRERHRRKEFKG